MVLSFARNPARGLSKIDAFVRATHGPAPGNFRSYSNKIAGSFSAGKAKGHSLTLSAGALHLGLYALGLARRPPLAYPTLRMSSQRVVQQGVKRSRRITQSSETRAEAGARIPLP